MTKKEIDWQFSKRQIMAFNLLRKDETKEILYGGAKGGGKSVLGCRWAYWYACEIAKMCNVPISDYPVPVGFIGRKQSVDFSDTTFETWKKFIPPQNYIIKEQAKEIIILDAKGRGWVKICYGGFDREETVNKFNSAEYAFYFIDQAEELSETEIGMVRASLRLKINDIDIPTKGLLTANPRQCWLKDEFITSKAEGKHFVQALPSDNPYLHESYIEQLTDSFKHRPELLEAYLHGSWDSLEGSDQVIKYGWVEQASKRKRLNMRTVRKIIACDPARFGDDETVIYYFEDGIICDEEIYGQKDTMHTVGRIMFWMEKKDCETIAVDVIGLGAGIIDRLRELSNDRIINNRKPLRIIEINGAERENVPEKYYNKRAEMWDTVAKEFSDIRVILRDDGRDDYVLKNQLCIPLYEFRNSQLLIENKDKIKKRLNSSPDRADAYIMGKYVSMKFRPPESVSYGVRVKVKSPYSNNVLSRGFRRRA